MPFYDFRCANNHRFELKQSYSAEPVTNCPTCAQPAKRLISLVPVHFKGSGFYVNDYGKKEPPSSEGKDVGGEGKSGKGVETKDGKAVEATAKGGEAAKPEAGKSEPAKAAKAESLKAESSSRDKAPSTGSKDKSLSGAAPSRA